MAIVKRMNRSGSLRYQVKVKDPRGGWLPSPSFESLQDAKLYEAELIRQKKRTGGRVSLEDAKRTTLSEYWEVWSRKNRGETSAGWRLSQDQMWRDYIKPTIGEMKLVNIGIPEIGEVMSYVAELGRAPATQLHVYNLLNGMFGDAVEYYQMLYENPVKKKHHRPKLVQKVAKFLPPEEAFKLLEFAKDHRFGPALWIMMLTGMRVSELIALKWDAVLFDQDQIVIRSAWNKKVRVMQHYPKNQAQAYVPMPQILKEYLMERRGEGFIVTGSKGKHVPYDTLYENILKLCSDAGVARITPHEFRHSATEVYVQHGASQQDIRRLLNHKSEASTAKYIHRTDGRLSGIASKIVPSLSVIAGGKKVGNTG